MIHRDDFEAYLKHNEKWPASGLLANWFDDAKPKSGKRKIREPVADDNAQEEEAWEPWREIDIWLFDTWCDLGKPGATDFFRVLRKYNKTKGSPINGYYPLGDKPGFDWKTKNDSDFMARGTLRNLVTKFKKFTNKKPVNT